MSFCSSSPHRIGKYGVFLSFHGVDVPPTFFSPWTIQEKFESFGITMFDGDESGLNPEKKYFTKISESKISIVVLMMTSASKSRLYKLLRVLVNKKEMGEIVIPVFYVIDPSDLRQQTGYFWNAFITTSYGISHEVERWSKDLEDVGNITPKYLINKDNESEMIKKISRDILTIAGHGYSTGTEIVVVINLAVEITSAVLEHLSSIREPKLAKISIGTSSLSVFLSGLDLFFKIRAHGARFRCKWPIPWFYYYKARDGNRILGNLTDTVLLFCAVCGLIVSTVNWIYIKRGQEGPIKASVVWPLSFAFGMAGTVLYNKFIKANLANSKDD